MRRLTALALLSVYLALPACTDLKTVGVGAVDCAKQSVSSSAGAILGDVVKIATTGGATWQADLTALGIKVGGDALACAVKMAREQLAAKTADGGTRDLTTARGLERLDAFSMAKGFVYAPGGAK